MEEDDSHHFITIIHLHMTLSSTKCKFPYLLPRKATQTILQSQGVVFNDPARNRGWTILLSRHICGMARERA